MSALLDRHRVAWASLAFVASLSAAGLVGFAVFGRHPALLNQVPGAANIYGAMFIVAPRAQIIAALLALALVLSLRTRARWVPAFAAVYLVSLGSELAGTTVGLPFGPYHYSEGLGLKLFGHVPALIPASWFFMALPSYALAAHRFPDRRWARVFFASLILLSWDLSLDPAMSLVTRYWIWGTDGTYYGMPLLNLAGWYVTGLAIMETLQLLRVERWLRDVSLRWLAAFYCANLILPVGMSLAAGLWGAVIASGAALAVCVLIARPTRVPVHA